MAIMLFRSYNANDIVGVTVVFSAAIPPSGTLSTLNINLLFNGA